MKAAILCALVAGCSGCGGGGESAPACLSTIKVQLFGDSTMYGYDALTGGQVSPSPAQVLQQGLDARFGVGRVTVELSAVSTTDTKMLLDGKDGVNLPWPQSVHADIVVINMGINDFSGHRPLADYSANLAKLAVNPARVTIFETPNPNKFTLGGAPLGNYAQAMRDVARGLPLADTYAYVLTLPDWEGLMADGAHPTVALYGLIATNSVLPVLAQEVQRLSCR